MLTREVVIEGPYDVRRTHGALVRGAHDPTGWLADDELVRASRTPDGPGTLQVVLTRDDGPTVARATAWGEGAAWLLAHVEDVLGARDAPPVAERFPEPVRSLARRARGMRLPRVPRVFELLVPVVLEQLVTGIESKRAFASLVRATSERAPGPLEDLFLPPDPARVQRVAPDAWMPLGILRQQGETLRRVAERAHRLEAAAELPLDDATTLLTAIPGIGPWTAGAVLLHGLGHADAIPVGDYHLPNTVAWNLAREDRADDARMLELLAPFAGERGRVLRILESAGASAPRYGPRRPLRAGASPRGPRRR